MLKRIIVVVGHYGSGKTEFSVNLAFHQREMGEKVALLDMDIANPYFRSRERQAELEAKGVEVYYNAYGYDITEDLPAITADLRTPLEDGKCRVIVDVGGDGTGARILNQFRKYFVKDDSCMICVINANRPETDTVEGTLKHMAQIETETGMKIDGIVNNTHLLAETSLQDILRGYRLCKKVSEHSGIPICFSACRSNFCESLQNLYNKKKKEKFPVFALTLHMRPSWLDMK